MNISNIYGGVSGKIKENLGVGFNMGGHQIYGDNPTESGIGLGFEGLANYTFRKNKFGVITSLGFGWIKGRDKIENSDFSTSLMTLDVKAAFWPLLGKRFNPYGFLGLGAFNFSYPKDPSKRYFDASFILGAAVELMLTPKIGLNTSLDYRYTTGDDLDLQNGGFTDGYANGRIGLTFYFKERGAAPPEKVIAEVPIEEFDDSSGQTDQQALQREQAYLQLKSEVDELSEQIGIKDSEIQELKILLDSRQEKIEQLEKGIGVKPRTNIGNVAIDPNNFALSYEQALQNFYAREYDVAISMFSGLLQTDPNNRLAGNCQYWIGESYYGKRDYSGAIGAFDKVLAYSNSHKNDDSLLMMGLCYLHLGRNSMARESFGRLINEYPESEYREKAERYLSELEQ